MRKKWKVIVLAGIGLLVAMQLIPVRRTNPPVTGDLKTPPEVRRILGASCYDCHSHETHWPFYSYVAPVSWFIAHDVHEGRGRVNFSEWDAYPESAREFLRNDVYNQVSEGEMPPWPYLLLHPSARVGAAALDVLKQWAGSAPGADDGRTPDEGDRRDR